MMVKHYSTHPIKEQGGLTKREGQVFDFGVGDIESIGAVPKGQPLFY